MDDFIETPRFPDVISFGSTGGPGFKTFIFDGLSGIELRNMDWTKTRGKYEIHFEDVDGLDMLEIKSWFLNTAGRARGFRFKDWHDFELTDGEIGVGDGTSRSFNLVKLYGTAPFTYQRRLFKPVTSTLSIKVDDVTNTQWTADYSTGIVTFNMSHAPASLAVVTATCEFDVPVRFDTDTMMPSAQVHDMQSWTQATLVELNLD